MKSSLPMISSTTFGEKFVIFYILMSLLPCLHLFANCAPDEDMSYKRDLIIDLDRAGFWMTIAIVAISTLTLLFLTYRQSKLLN